jgi:hypothetical protein
MNQAAALVNDSQRLKPTSSYALWHDFAALGRFATCGLTAQGRALIHNSASETCAAPGRQCRLWHYNP